MQTAPLDDLTCPSPTQLSIGCANAGRRFTSTPSCKSLCLRCTLRWAHRPGCRPSQRDGNARVQFLLRALARVEPVCPSARTAEPYLYWWTGPPDKGAMQARKLSPRPDLRCEILKTLLSGRQARAGALRWCLCAKARVSGATDDGPSSEGSGREKKKKDKPPVGPPVRMTALHSKPDLHTGRRRQQVGA